MKNWFISLVFFMGFNLYANKDPVLQDFYKCPKKFILFSANTGKFVIINKNGHCRSLYDEARKKDIMDFTLQPTDTLIMEGHTFFNTFFVSSQAGKMKYKLFYTYIATSAAANYPEAEIQMSGGYYGQAEKQIVKGVNKINHFNDIRIYDSEKIKKITNHIYSGDTPRVVVTVEKPVTFKFFPMLQSPYSCESDKVNVVYSLDDDFNTDFRGKCERVDSNRKFSGSLLSIKFSMWEPSYEGREAITKSAALYVRIKKSKPRMRLRVKMTSSYDENNSQPLYERVVEVAENAEVRLFGLNSIINRKIFKNSQRIMYEYFIHLRKNRGEVLSYSEAEKLWPPVAEYNIKEFNNRITVLNDTGKDLEVEGLEFYWKLETEEERARFEAQEAVERFLKK